MRTLVCGLLAAAGVSLSGSAASAQAAPGTYTLALCRSAPCTPADTGAAYLTATVVLLDSADAARRRLAPPAWERGAANGCFTVRHHREQRDSYAGIEPGGSLRWTSSPGDSGRIVFALYRSPDAGYTVRVTSAAGRLAGSGRSYGAGAAEIVAPPDTVVAVRVGAPNAARCQ